MAASQPQQPIVFGEVPAPGAPGEPLIEPAGIGRELIGGGLLAASVYLFVALSAGEDASAIVGVAGESVAAVLRFFFGNVVVLALPFALGAAAVQVIFRRPRFWSRVTAPGVVFLIVALCGFLALPGADNPEVREETFARSGAVGAFLVEWEGLRLVGALGDVGAALALGIVFFAGLLLTTGRGIAWGTAGVVEWLKAQEARRARPEFASPPSEEEIEAISREFETYPVRLDPRAAAKSSGVAVAPFAEETPTPLARNGNAHFEELPTPLPSEPAATPRLLEPVELAAPKLDADAENALRALEEIDADFERALEAENAGPLAPPTEVPVSAPAEPTISFGDAVPAARILEGNPANEARARAAVAPPTARPTPAQEKEEELARLRDEAKQSILSLFGGGAPPKPAPAADEAAPEDPTDLSAPTSREVELPWESEAPIEAPAVAPRVVEPPAPTASKPNRPQALPPAPAVVPKRGLLADLGIPTVDALGVATPAPEPPAPPAGDAAAAATVETESPAESDPLFRTDLETRPRGPMAALAEATKRPAEPPPAPKVFRLPDIQLLNDPPQVDTRTPREELLEISQTLERTLDDFGISAKVVEVKQGPVVTRFELKPAPGVKVSRIVGLEHDIAMALKAVSVRILAPVPGKAVVGIEVPNRVRAGVYLKELIACAEFWEHPSPLAFALGKTIDGAPYFCDLKKMPHLLIAGATGAGKSVCLNTIICSLLYRQRPEKLRLIMVDPKRVELSIYADVPHLIAPVVCEPKRAAAALAWAVEEMENRYKKLVELSVRNIDGYNAIVEDPSTVAKKAIRGHQPMPHLVVIVDELADLMICAKAEVEESIQRLAQMARAVGIHLILATQRPSVNVITGIIKANFPSRIAFQVSQKVDSRTILDQNGAEALLGRGDMLFSPGGAPKPIRVQGCFLSDEEVERLAEFWREQSPPQYEIEEFEPLLSEKEMRELAKLAGNPVDADDLDRQQSFLPPLKESRGTNKTMGAVSAGLFIPHAGGSAQAGDDEIDEALVRAAARVVLEGGKGSTSMVQRRLKVGFARAGRLMDMLEQTGLVGPYQGSKPREVLVDIDAALAQLDALEGRDPSRRAANAAMDDGDAPPQAE